MFLIAHAFKGQVHVFAGHVKIVSHWAFNLSIDLLCLAVTARHKKKKYHISFCIPWKLAFFLEYMYTDTRSAEIYRIFQTTDHVLPCQTNDSLF